MSSYRNKKVLLLNREKSCNKSKIIKRILFIALPSIFSVSSIAKLIIKTSQIEIGGSIEVVILLSVFILTVFLNFIVFSGEYIFVQNKNIKARTSKYDLLYLGFINLIIFIFLSGCILWFIGV